MPSTTGFDQLFAITVTAAFAIYALRCLGGLGLFFLAQLPTRWSASAARLSGVITPRLVRRLLTVVVGLAGTGVLASPAIAADIPDFDRGPTSPATISAPVDAASAAPDANASLISRATTQRVQVLRGDCLWSLAREQLPVGSGARRIDRQWHRWYDLNRDRIGDDPNLIRTGQWLQVPSAEFGGGSR